MHEPYWQLDRPAFECDADPQFYFPASSHEGALLKLRYVVEHRKGAALLAAPHGMGKTYLTHILSAELGDEHYVVVRVVYPKLQPTELLCDFAARLGSSVDWRDEESGERVLRRLEQRLEQLTIEQRQAVLIVDEAHLLDAEHLQTLQLLMNLRDAPRLDFTLILVGQPELLPRVRRVRGLDSRIAARTTLRPLSVEETAEYASHRLRIAGRADSPFSDDALRTICELSQGAPRRINQLCDLALLIGYADEARQLTAVDAEAAAAELACVSVD
jgi:general secretion pathway protein A